MEAVYARLGDVGGWLPANAFGPVIPLIPICHTDTPSHSSSFRRMGLLLPFARGHQSCHILHEKD